MKTLITLATLFASLNASAAPKFDMKSYERCIAPVLETLDKADQKIIAHYRDAIVDKSAASTDLYIQALENYVAANPNRAIENASIVEGGSGTYCYDKNRNVHQTIGTATEALLLPRAYAGDYLAIKIILAYSALYPSDGADAEGLAEIQAELKKKAPHQVKFAIAANASFFKKHPIQWIPN